LLNPRYPIEDEIQKVREVYGIFKQTYPNIDVEERYNNLINLLNEKLRMCKINTITEYITRHKSQISKYEDELRCKQNEKAKICLQIANLEKIPDPIKRQSLQSAKTNLVANLEKRINFLAEKINELHTIINTHNETIINIK
jgi:16S rRNA G527 N7-methylase RsmG